MRCHASHFHVFLALLLLAISTHRATGAPTCKTLVDFSSTLAKSLESWTETDLSEINFPSVFTKVDTVLPWLSTCAAAIDPKAVYTSLASSSTVKSYLSTLEDFDEDLSTEEGWSAACPMVENTILPCVKFALADSIMDAVNSAGGCCDDFLAEFKTLFGGDDLDDMVIKLLQLGLNVACSERLYPSTKDRETCGLSIYQSFTFIDSDEDISSLLSLAQIPNDQMCDAFAGKQFTNTKGGTTIVAFGTDGAGTIGICLEPVDPLLQYLKSWGIFSKTVDVDGTSVSLSDPFTSGKSIRGSLLFNYAAASSNLPMMVLQAIDKVVAVLSDDDDDDDEESHSASLADWFQQILDGYKSDATAVLLHVPNNGGCTYSDQTISLPYAETAASVGASPSGASSIELSDLVTMSVVLVLSLAMGALPVSPR